MNGLVDESGRALLQVEVRPDVDHEAVGIDVWIDTGFTGDLVLPRRTVESLDLPQSGSVDAVLADGSRVELKTYTCVLDWFGLERRLEVVANDGDYPLLGVGLLLGLELGVNYRSLTMTLGEPKE